MSRRGGEHRIGYIEDFTKPSCRAPRIYVRRCLVTRSGQAEGSPTVSVVEAAAADEKTLLG
jgi:hypothetical protein